jgi:hypothetical protein
MLVDWPERIILLKRNACVWRAGKHIPSAFLHHSACISPNQFFSSCGPCLSWQAAGETSTNELQELAGLVALGCFLN